MTFMRERRGWEGDLEEDDGGHGVEGGVGVEEDYQGTFNLTISPCLKRGARLGRIPPAASSDIATDCDMGEDLQGSDFVQSLDGILFLTRDAREGMACLEGKVAAIFKKKIKILK